jgi:hypothetical protein
MVMHDSGGWKAVEIPVAIGGMAVATADTLLNVASVGVKGAAEATGKELLKAGAEELGKQGEKVGKDAAKAAGEEVKTCGKLKPDPNAQGSHTVFKVDPKTGKVKKYETYEPQTNPKNPNPWQPGKRFDKAGKSHFNKETQERVPTPHVHDPITHGGVRPAQPNEIPK